MTHASVFDSTNRLFVFYLQQGNYKSDLKTGYPKAFQGDFYQQKYSINQICILQKCFQSSRNRAKYAYPTVVFSISSDNGNSFFITTDIGYHEGIDLGGNIVQIYAVANHVKNRIYLFMKNQIGILMVKQINPTMYTQANKDALKPVGISDDQQDDKQCADSGADFKGGMFNSYADTINPLIVICASYNDSFQQKQNQFNYNFIKNIKDNLDKQIYDISIGSKEEELYLEQNILNISISAYFDKKGTLRLFMLNPDQNKDGNFMRISSKSSYNLISWKTTFQNVNFFGVQQGDYHLLNIQDQGLQQFQQKSQMYNYIFSKQRTGDKRLNTYNNNQNCIFCHGQEQNQDYLRTDEFMQQVSRYSRNVKVKAQQQSSSSSSSQQSQQSVQIFATMNAIYREETDQVLLIKNFISRVNGLVKTSILIRSVNNEILKTIDDMSKTSKEKNYKDYTDLNFTQQSKNKIKVIAGSSPDYYLQYIEDFIYQQPGYDEDNSINFKIKPHGYVTNKGQIRVFWFNRLSRKNQIGAKDQSCSIRGCYLIKDKYKNTYKVQRNIS